MASNDTVHIVAALVASRNFQVDLERRETIPVLTGKTGSHALTRSTGQMRED